MTPYELCTPGRNVLNPAGSDNFLTDDAMTTPPTLTQAFGGRYDTSTSSWYLQIAPIVDQENRVFPPCANVFWPELDFGFQVDAETDYFMLNSSHAHILS